MLKEVREGFEENIVSKTKNMERRKD